MILVSRVRRARTQAIPGYDLSAGATHEGTILCIGTDFTIEEQGLLGSKLRSFTFLFQEIESSYTISLKNFLKYLTRNPLSECGERERVPNNGSMQGCIPLK